MRSKKIVKELGDEKKKNINEFVIARADKQTFYMSKPACIHNFIYPAFSILLFRHNEKKTP